VERRCDTQEWIENSGPSNKLPDINVSTINVSGDWLSIHDRTDLDGFYLAIGTSGNQTNNAPMVGPIRTLMPGPNVVPLATLQ
jgi:hypothetical protein